MPITQSYESVKFQSSLIRFSSELCSDKLVGQPNQAKYFVYQKDKRIFTRVYETVAILQLLTLVVYVFQSL